MKFSHFFIERPVFAAVISILIILMGVIAFPTLAVSQYPDIVPPTINISATYPGASAETLADSVTAPIEEQINGVENMLYMSSNSTGDGHVNITVTFKLGTDPNQAQVLVENRVATATPHLPEEVVASGVLVRKSSADILLAVHMYSPDGSLDQKYIANYVGLHIRDVLLRLPGVGDIQSRAARDYAMRIWIDPDKAAARNLTVDDITGALKSHNVQVAAGAVGQPPSTQTASAYQLNVEALGRLSTPEQFGDIVLKTAQQGQVTRLTDVARIELGAADYTTNAYLDRKPAVALAVLAQPGSNALQGAATIKSTMEKLKESFPPGLDYKIIYNPTEYVQASITEVEKTLFIALALVVVVIVVFLQSWRAAIIPIVAIPVALIGTFAVMAAAGFSINTLTLFGLVLAIGIVVDDAIVVVENIERHLRAGMSPREAAHVTMDEVGGALVAIALVLASVFVPSAFISGISGQFYRQFALTIASATVLSLTVSLTLSPALAALVLKPHGAEHDAGQSKGRMARAMDAFSLRFNRAFDRLGDRYSGIIRKLVRMTVVMLAVYVGLLLVTGWRMGATPSGFIPAQDQGNLLVAVNLPAGSALTRTDAVMRDVTRRLLAAPGVRAASVYAGVDATTGTTNSNAGQIYAVLDPFETRLKHGLTTTKISDDLRNRFADINGADIKVIPPPPVRGIGTTGGFKMIVEDQGGAGYPALEAAANKLAAAAQQSPVLGSAFASFNTKTPRLYADIDRTKAEMLGVPDSSVFDTLQTYLGSTFVNDFNLFGRTFQVIAQADDPFRVDQSALTEIRTRSTSGAMVPLGSVMNVRHVTGPYRVLRYNLYPSAEVQGSAAPGRSSGEAEQAIQKLAHEVLPAGFTTEWTELAYQEQVAGDTGLIAFGLAVVFVFLLLAALYESVTLPLAVILIVPMCLLAAILGVNLFRSDNNILTQIGFIVLIGLAAKNAILIVEFARQNEEERSEPPEQAAAEAGRLRLRPILMTSFAFILGVSPLAFASGAGAEMRQALGVAVFFGMIGVTGFGLIFTPVFYVVCRGLSKRIPQPPTRRRLAQRAAEADAARTADA
ncbi:MAG: efflux RND transporter permease subunit [Phenylobacterium sp.]|nr:MAG: efflux RND transporter permease subunit [Phenylobacterium sp.]